MIEMAGYPRHFFAKTSPYGVIDDKGSFSRDLQSPYRFGRDLFMTLAPIQVLPIHRVIKHILAHGSLQTFASKVTNRGFLQP